MHFNKRYLFVVESEQWVATSVLLPIEGREALGQGLPAVFEGPRARLGSAK